MDCRDEDSGVKAVQNEGSGVWHLVGSRSCGGDPAGDTYGTVIEGNWAEVRDHVDRDAGERCRRCRWPPR